MGHRRAVRRAVRLFASERPSCYFSWVGIEKHTNAMQPNRAVCCFYALTGQFDESGSNVLTASTPTRPVDGPELLPKEKAAIRLGLNEHPLGPPNDRARSAGPSTCDPQRRAIKVKAMLWFGSDPLLGTGGSPAREGSAVGPGLLRPMDIFANPTAVFADMLLPAARDGRPKPSRRTSPSMAHPLWPPWAQLSKAVVPPWRGTRTDWSYF